MINSGVTRRGFFSLLVTAAALVVPIKVLPSRWVVAWDLGYDKGTMVMAKWTTTPDDRVYDPSNVRVTIAGVVIEPSTYMENKHGA